MKETFEDFLRTQHADGYTGLDDDMPDNFEDWLSKLDTEDLLVYGEKMRKYTHLQGYNEGWEDAKGEKKHKIAHINEPSKNHI